MGQLNKKMVQVKKLRNTYCSHAVCRSHKTHRVSQYKKGRESKFCQGRRRYDAKQAGFGGQTKQIQKRKYKITKKVTLRLECIVPECKQRRFLVLEDANISNSKRRRRFNLCDT